MLRLNLFQIALLSAVIFYADNSLLPAMSPSESNMLDTLRQKYYAAVDDKKEIAEFENYLIQFTENNTNLKAIVLAYEGGLAALKSKFSFLCNIKN